ncbi:MAG: hypothetical protein FWD72_00950, partial [Eggerthellaceae bacterium]|nr:hypothetical protein [Eggerthellaceae bacterium]
LILGKAVHTRDMPVTADDRIVLLSTCSGATTNGRDILIGKITEKPSENAFQAPETGEGASTVDALRGLFEGAPWYAQAALLVLPLLLILFLIYRMRKLAQKRPRKT